MRTRAGSQILLLVILLSLLVVCFQGCSFKENHSIQGLITDVKYNPARFTTFATWVVYFEDGRVKLFYVRCKGIEGMFVIGKINKIYYHRSGRYPGKAFIDKVEQVN